MSQPLQAERSEELELSSFPDLIENKFKEIKEYRSNLHLWDRSIRGFRQDHNFNLSLSTFSGEWTGEIPNVLSPIQYSTTQLKFRADYHFHIRLWSKFGYFLGTGLGVTLDEQSNSSNFNSPSAYDLPGVVLGLVWNINPIVRLSAGGDLHLTRLDKFFHGDQAILITGRTLSRNYSVDIFLAIGDAIRIQYSRSDLRASSDNGVLIERRSDGVSVGWLRHLI